MAFLSAINDNGSEVASSASQLTLQDIVMITIIMLVGLLFIGLVWGIVQLINITDEKKKYYKNLNKKLKKEVK